MRKAVIGARNGSKHLLQGGETMLPTGTLSNTMDGLGYCMFLDHFKKIPII